MRLLRVLFVLATLMSVTRAQAFTPENGTWWNPAEPGTGFLIEIQDNFLFLAGYMYAPDGRPMWYTSQGLMNGNARFVGELSSFRDGQCLGCVYTPPVASVGAGGPVEIIFDTEVKARITLGGRTVPIERFDYYLTRSPGDPKTEMMLGEWQMVIDFAADPGISYPFYGDILVFDLMDRAPNPDVFDGCRANNSLEGRCTNSALANHDAAGFYRASTKDHFIVVNDSPNNFAYYVVTTGTYQFDGIVKICPKGLQNPTTQCLQSNNYRAYPVRGFRTASRTFVETGAGPSGANGVEKQAHARGSIASAMSGATMGLDHDAVKARFNIDLDDLPVAELEALTARMGSKRR